MSRLVARAESWERAYEAFNNINFAAFDYRTVKSSLLDYVKLYYPESFNDFIETSEFVAIVESFAYIAELMAYRLDVNAHENFITVAQRKDSILRLAKLVSYSAARPLPARGLVKIQSVSTTESVVDATGADLANRTIRWNDVSNPSWKDQFILVMNRTLDQRFGTVGPTDRFQIQDVLFEMYAWNGVPSATGVFPYSANVGGQSIPMELVPAEYNTSDGIVERRPANNSKFSFLYGQDGLGDASSMTGFFCFTKQGSLQRFRHVFDGVTPNQTYDINASNINETDIWLNQVNPATGATVDDRDLSVYQRIKTSGKSGEWVKVDLAHAQNVIFNNNPTRIKYEVETRDENRARLIFGDGEFAEIPAGTFDIWARTSLDQDISVPQSSITGATSSFTYIDSYGRTQTFTITYTLVNSLQNASASEDIEHTRVTAPAVYYSQDRMVNGEDYNSFMLQDSSILKLRSINRTFAGDSKYITWHDASGTYENVKVFSDDGAVYYKSKSDSEITPIISSNVLIDTYLQPILSLPEMYLTILSEGVDISKYRRTFNTEERNAITTAFVDNTSNRNVLMYYNLSTTSWSVVKVTGSEGDGPVEPGQYIDTPLIRIEQLSNDETTYRITRTTRQMVLYSETTAFWNTNDGSSVIDYATLRTNSDEITLLQANINNNRNGILGSNVAFNVIGLETVESGPNVGLPDVSRVAMVPVDKNGDGIPDDVSLETYINPEGIASVIMPKVPFDVSNVTLPTSTLINQGLRLKLPIPYVVDPSVTLTRPDHVAAFLTNDVRVYGGNSDVTTDLLMTQGDDWATVNSAAAFEAEAPRGSYVTNEIVLLSNGNRTNLGSDVDVNNVLVKVKEYIYFSRATRMDEWVLSPTTSDTIASFVNDVNAFLVKDETKSSQYRPLTIKEADERSNTEFERTRTWIRFEGRGSLNFAWFHHTPRYSLVDPSPTNIIDTYMVTKGYYNSVKRWLDDPSQPRPQEPTPLDLRTSYSYMVDNKMISDTLVMRPGKFKILFGSRAPASLRLTFKVIRSAERTMTDNQIKTVIVATVRNFFNLSLWEFGETFYFTELAAAIHLALSTEISSVVPVPTYPQNQFGDLFQVMSREDEMFVPDISVDNIEIVSGYTPTNIRMNG